MPDKFDGFPNRGLASQLSSAVTRQAYALFYAKFGQGKDWVDAPESAREQLMREARQDVLDTVEKQDLFYLYNPELKPPPK